MKRPILIVAGSLVFTTPVHSQSFVGVAVVDSASIARAAYRRAIQATDPAIAAREIARSATAWPTQPAYLWARSLLAARSNDTAATLDALEAYAALSLGRDLHAIRDLTFLASHPGFQKLRARHDANRAPLVASRIVREVPDTTFWPEGLDFDPAARAYFVGGVRRGTITRIDSLGRATTFWSDDPGQRSSVLGVRVDVKRRSLWATTSGIPQRESFMPADSGNASLVELGLDDGRVKRRWNLPPAPGGHVLGDLAIGPDGDVFFTDSSHPVLYRLRPGADSLEVTRHALFYSLQGVAPTPDGTTLYIADYSHGLLRLDLATGVVERLTDAPRSTSLGCDGLTWHSGLLICVQNGVWPARITRFRLDEPGRAILDAEVIDRNFAVADEPTIGTIAGDEFVYVATSQWEKHDASGKPLPRARRRGVVLLGVRIR